MIKATLIKTTGKFSFWMLSQELPYANCIHHDDIEAVDASKICETENKTSYIMIHTNPVSTMVYPSNSLGKIVSLETIMTVYPREYYLWRDHKEIIQLLFKNEQIQYNESSCDLDNWHPHESI